MKSAKPKAKKSKPLTETVTFAFFGELLGGEHRIPKSLENFGAGQCIAYSGDMATFDTDFLTRLVLLAHKYCIRVEIQPLNASFVRIAIWQRVARGNQFERHPTITKAIQDFDKRHKHYWKKVRS